MKKDWIDFFNVLQDFGLSLDETTGGHFHSHVKGVVEQSHYVSNYRIALHNGTSIEFLDGNYFLKTLQETESSFNINFFVNV